MEAEAIGVQLDRGRSATVADSKPCTSAERNATVRPVFKATITIRNRLSYRAAVACSSVSVRTRACSTAASYSPVRVQGVSMDFPHALHGSARCC